MKFSLDFNMSEYGEFELHILRWAIENAKEHESLQHDPEAETIIEALDLMLKQVDKQEKKCGEYVVRQ